MTKERTIKATANFGTPTREERQWRYEVGKTPDPGPVHTGGTLDAIAFGIFMLCEEVRTILFEEIGIAHLHVRTIPVLPQEDERLRLAIDHYRPVYVLVHHAR